MTPDREALITLRVSVAIAAQKSGVLLESLGIIDQDAPYAVLRTAAENVEHGWGLLAYDTAALIPALLRDLNTVEAERNRLRTMLAQARPRYYHCGTCEQWHSILWEGDCRSDDNRFTADQLDALYHGPGWEEVPEPT